MLSIHNKAVLLLLTTTPSIFTFANETNIDAINKASLRGQNGSSSTNRKTLSSPNKNIVSLPVLPHRQVLNRRRRELKTVDDTENNESRRQQYQRHLDGNAPPPPRHQQLGALYQGYGTHYVDIWVGKPNPQRQTVIVDTGSSVTAFPCSGCHNCGESYHTDSYFIKEDSETYQATDCGSGGTVCKLGYCVPGMEGYEHDVCSVRMSYAEGSSWSAVEAVDYVYAGGMHDGAIVPNEGEGNNSADGEHLGDNPHDAYAFEFKLAFGCQYSITGLFVSQLADGIMGMEVSSNSFWKQMHSEGAIDEKRFSLCFSRQPTASRDGTEAGAMTLGGTDARLHASPMVYAANVHSTGFYTVYVKGIYIRSNGGESALPDSDDQVAKNIGASASTINYGNIIVDSGTTDTYMPETLYREFTDLWKEMAGGRPYSNSPVDLSHEELLALPTILFQLEAHTDSIDETLDPATTVGLAGRVDPENPRDIVLAVPASHYMEFDPKTGKYTARIYLSERSGGVLGANSMMGHDIYFDDEESRIGFAESNCDYMSIIEGAEAPTRQ